MPSASEMFDALGRTADSRRRLDEMIEKFVRAAVVRLHMTPEEIASLTGWTKSKARSVSERVSQQPDDRPPPSDPSAGRTTIVSTLPELVRTRDQSDELVQRIARICVVKHGMSANELARRTGHSRDFTQKWVKRMHAEPEPEPATTRPSPGGMWVTPSWEDTSPVDEVYIISPEEAQRRKEAGAYDPPKRAVLNSDMAVGS